MRPTYARKALPLFALILAGVAVLLPQAVQSPRPLSGLMPAGPLLYLEAKDFAALWKDWNASNEKKSWLTSDNFQVFSRSRLFLRLTEAQGQFAAAAGFAPDTSLVDAAAGSNSALALYDIGNLEFLYITRMQSAQVFQTMLWQSRAKFQPRKSGGIDYFVRQQQNRLAAFAVTNDLLLIATQEQALASALALIAGQPSPAMNQEPWYRRAVTAQPVAGDLRLALNFERVARTPYFRSYWVQRNTKDLRQFQSIIADLDRTPAEYRERRSLVRAEPGVDRRPLEAAVGEILRAAPPDAGLIWAWAKPEVSTALAVFEQRLFPSPVEMQANPNRAPSAGQMDSAAGSEEDLETRIDEAPLADDTAKVDLQQFRTLLEQNDLQSLMVVESSEPAADKVFVANSGAIVTLAARPWDAAAVRSALEPSISRQWSLPGNAVAWTERQGTWTLSGLGKITVATAGRILVAGNSERLVSAVAARAAATTPPVAGASHSMRFLHARELPNLQRMLTLIDYPAYPAAPGSPREPLLFSENLASLARTLGRVDSVSLESHDDGGTVTQRVVYKLQ